MNYLCEACRSPGVVSTCANNCQLRRVSLTGVHLERGLPCISPFVGNSSVAWKTPPASFNFSVTTFSPSVIEIEPVISAPGSLEDPLQLLPCAVRGELSRWPCGSPATCGAFAATASLHRPLLRNLHGPLMPRPQQPVAIPCGPGRDGGP